MHVCVLCLYMCVLAYVCICVCMRVCVCVCVRCMHVHAYVTARLCVQSSALLAKRRMETWSCAGPVTSATTEQGSALTAHVSCAPTTPGPSPQGPSKSLTVTYVSTSMVGFVALCVVCNYVKCVCI